MPVTAGQRVIIAGFVDLHPNTDAGQRLVTNAISAGMHMTLPPLQPCLKRPHLLANLLLMVHDCGCCRTKSESASTQHDNVDILAFLTVVKSGKYCPANTQPAAAFIQAFCAGTNVDSVRNLQQLAMVLSSTLSGAGGTLSHDMLRQV